MKGRDCPNCWLSRILYDLQPADRYLTEAGAYVKFLRISQKKAEPPGYHQDAGPAWGTPTGPLRSEWVFLQMAC